MYHIEYFPPGSPVPALIDVVEADSAAAALATLHDNNYYDALSCCHSTMDRASYEGCTVVLKAPDGEVRRYCMHDDPEGGPPYLTTQR